MHPSVQPAVTDDRREATAWHASSTVEVAARLDVDPKIGLAAADARRRRGQTGPNALPEPARRPAWRLFIDQFRNLLVVVLLGAAVLAGVVGDWKDTAVIAVVLTINAVLGFVQEHRAERSLAALQAMSTPSARVRRDGRAQLIDATDVVPGDVVIVEAGDRIPADGRLRRAHDLEVDESSLTGESVPVAKHTDPLPDGPVAVGDRANVGFMQTSVTRGRGELIVTATGMQTEIGRLASLLARTSSSPTPLQRQLGGLARRLAAVAGVAVLVYLVIGFVRGEPAADLVLSAVALAVAAIPEGLPAVVTITLALGVRRLATRNAIVKRLASVETLGSASVICTDKTGTLTLNQMTARTVVIGDRHLDVTGVGYSADGAIIGGDIAPSALTSALTAAALCSDAEVTGGTAVGDPTEVALVTLAAKGGVDVDLVRTTTPRIAELPFDSTTKRMVTMHGGLDGDVRLIMKGAPDVVARHATTVQGRTGPVALDRAARERIDRHLESLGSRGLRVIALAERTVPRADIVADPDVEHHLDGLTWTALVGIEDPPRPEVAAAVAQCRDAGIDVRMVTGDHAATATAIARQVGIDGTVVTGAMIDGWSDDEFAARIVHVGVVARVAPEHKLRLVRALQASGEVVAMTGDGVNDAPALQGADIGVAMGVAGTDVTREAAALVLTDDNFATIVRAVEGGRSIYANIVKFVRFQLATNIGAIGAFLAAAVVGLPAPFTALQMLWVNLIMDGPPALALGVDPPSGAAMRKPPRDPRQALLSGTRLRQIVLVGVVMAGGTLALLALALQDLPRAQAMTLTFTTFVLFQVANALNARFEEATIFQRDSLRNRPLWLALGAVIALQWVVVHFSPAQALFETTALTWAQWATALGVASSVIWVEELRKLLRRRAR
jgi:Ca2+-transporting ATPase